MPAIDTTEIDRLPEPARSVARQVVADLIDAGHPPEKAAYVAARQAACFVSERAWDATVSCSTVLQQVEAGVLDAAE